MPGYAESRHSAIVIDTAIQLNFAGEIEVGMYLKFMFGAASFRTERIVAVDSRIGVAMDLNHAVSARQFPPVAGVKGRTYLAAVRFAVAAVAKHGRDLQIRRQLARARNEYRLSCRNTRQMLIDVVKGGRVQGEPRSDLQSLARFVCDHALRSEIRIARQMYQRK